MAEELFGTPIGVSRAEQDMARQAMTSAHVMQADTQAQLAPAVFAQRVGQARYLNAKAGVAENDADIQRRVAQAAAGREWTDDERANPAWTFANLYKDAGSPRDSMKAAGVAATIDQKRASADTNALRGELISARRKVVQAGSLASEMTLVDSPESLQAALQKHAQETGEQIPLLDEQGNLRPEVAEDWEGYKGKIKDMALTEKDRLATDYRERALASADAERRSKQDNRSFWQSTDNQEARERARSKGRIAKVGADIFDKAEGAKLGKDFVTNKFVGIDSSQATILGRQLAEQAKQARQLNPALTPTEASQEAFNLMDKQGLFGGLKQKPPGALESEKRPLKLPDNGDKSKLKEGFWYSDGTRKMQWGGAGKGWLKEQSGKGAAGKISQAARPAVAYTPPEDDTDNEDDPEDAALAMED